MIIAYKAVFGINLDVDNLVTQLDTSILYVLVPCNLHDLLRIHAISVSIHVTSWIFKIYDTF